MIDHVANNLDKDIDSGYDTTDVNCTVLSTITAMIDSEVIRIEMSPSLVCGLNLESHPHDPSNHQHPLQLPSTMCVLICHTPTVRRITLRGHTPTATQLRLVDESEPDEDKLAASWDRFRAKQEEMSEYGATALVIDIVGSPVPDTLVRAAMQCGIALLTSGNVRVQEKLAWKLTHKPSDNFYIAAREYIRARIHSINHEREMKKKARHASCRRRARALLSSYTLSLAPGRRGVASGHAAAQPPRALTAAAACADRGCDRLPKSPLPLHSGPPV